MSSHTQKMIQDVLVYSILRHKELVNQHLRHEMMFFGINANGKRVGKKEKKLQKTEERCVLIRIGNYIFLVKFLYRVFTEITDESKDCCAEKAHKCNCFCFETKDIEQHNQQHFYCFQNSCCCPHFYTV